MQLMLPPSYVKSTRHLLPIRKLEPAPTYHMCARVGGNAQCKHPLASQLPCRARGCARSHASPGACHSLLCLPRLEEGGGRKRTVAGQMGRGASWGGMEDAALTHVCRAAACTPAYARGCGLGCS